MLLTAAAALAGLLNHSLFMQGLDANVRWVTAGWALFFCGLTLLISIWLILRGVTLDRGLSFFTGIIYLVIFVIAKWLELFESMLGSAALFFAAGGILFATAWFWKNRQRWRGKEIAHG